MTSSWEYDRRYKGWRVGRLYGDKPRMWRAESHNHVITGEGDVSMVITANSLKHLKYLINYMGGR